MPSAATAKPSTPRQPPTSLQSSAPQHRYSGLAITLHWLLGIAIVATFALGWTMSGMSFSPQRLKFYNWHKWAGVAILGLSALRLLWRLLRRPPALPAHVASRMPRWQSVAHHATHHLFYLLFLAVPLLGWAYSSAVGFPIVFLGLFPLPDFVSPNADLADTLKLLHKCAAYSLAGLVALHVAAVLKHQLIDRDRLLSRMLPGRA
jgi:cytochrome b561